MHGLLKVLLATHSLHLNWFHLRSLFYTMHFTSATLIAVLAATPAVFGQLDTKIKAKGEPLMLMRLK